jgi:hypothetical protein
MVRIRTALLTTAVILTVAMTAGAQDILIATSGTELRATPQSDAPVVATLAGGERLMVFDAQGDWSQVETWTRSGRGFVDRLEGWLRTEKLQAVGNVETLVAPGPAQPPATAGASDPPAKRPAPRYAFDGRALSCHFEKQDFRGRLRADLYVDDVLRAWARTLNPLNWIQVRTDGPWGKAAGIEGNKRVLVRGIKRSKK